MGTATWHTYSPRKSFYLCILCFSPIMPGPWTTSTERDFLSALKSDYSLSLVEGTKEEFFERVITSFESKSLPIAKPEDVAESGGAVALESAYALT